MNFQNHSSRFASLRTFAQGMFNLNDPRWGRGEDKGDDAHRPEDRAVQAQSAGLVLVALVSLPIWMNSGVI